MNQVAILLIVVVFTVGVTLASIVIVMSRLLIVLITLAFVIIMAH